MGSSGATDGTLLVPDYFLLLLAQAVDAEAHDIAGLEIPGRLHSHADTGRRAGGDDVARHQREELREIGDEVEHPEHHGRRRTVLHPLAVDLEPEMEVLRVLHLIRGREPGAQRAERVVGLALGPLARTFGLE